MRDTLPVRVRFGAFELDLKAGELRLTAATEGESRIVLTEQPFRLLVMLVEREGEIATREEIKKSFWPNDTIVEFDHSINVAIGKLRKALGDSADEPKYIETLGRRGYRLIVPVEWVAIAEDSPDEVGAQVAGEAGAAVRMQADPGALTGRTVSHYRVLDIIGGGGMGVVYRAEDLKLGRAVALKFLPEELGGDPQALERFSREARAASSLDHPNICPIHEFGEHEGRPFIVMQLLDGQTLRDRLAVASPGERIGLDELLDIGVQVADGLKAAHERGIIHRDIKPANIFITNKGVAKILDFGLVKLLEGGEHDEIEAKPDDHSAAVKSNASSVGLTLTRTGMAMGTAGYMSPEQVRGEKLDARTDLFSFGLVLYEVGTGQRAFSGETAAVVHEAILKQTPVPVRELNSTLPAKLVRTINKALEKDREKRYQSAAEIRAELSSVEDFSGRRGKRPTGSRLFRLFVVALLLVSLAAVVAYVIRLRRPSLGTELKETQLTANSSESEIDNAAISPDGRYLAYNDMRGMHIKLLETGAIQSISSPNSFRKDQRVQWAPLPMSDTKFLADASVPEEADGTWSFSVTGGTPHKLRDNAALASASPDGSTVAFLARRGKVGYREIWLMDSSGEQARKIYQTDENGDLQFVEWSPKGRRLIYQKEEGSEDKMVVSLESLDVNGGPISSILSDSRLWSFKWLADGRLVYSLAMPDINGQTCNLWVMPIDESTGQPKSKPVQFTNWTGVCTGLLTDTADGKRLVTNKWSVQKSVYVADFDASKKGRIAATRLTLSDGQEKPVGWTADGKSIVFISNPNGRWGIYKQSPGKESAEAILTGLASPMTARMSPDGQWVLYQVFTGWSAGRLMRVSVNGGTPELVLTLTMPPEPNGWIGTHLHEPPRCARSPAKLCAIAERTPDGRQLVFTGFDPIQGRGRELVRFAIDPTSAYKWDLSPDGTRVAVLERSKGVMQILALKRGEERLITVDGWRNLETLDWAADGKGLFVSSPKKGSSVLLYVDLKGRATILWEQPGEQEGGADIYAISSPNGRHLAMYGWATNSNVWMLEGF